MQRTTHFMFLSCAIFGALCSFAACGGEDTDAAGGGRAKFVVDSLLTDVDGNSNGYVSFLPEVDLAGAKVDLGTAREFPGASDTWVVGKSIYIASGDAPRITRYARKADGTLVPEGVVAFESYGLTEGSAAFWNNVFVSATKAYMSNGPSELVVWNPTTMQIERTITVGGLEPKGALLPRASFADRSNVLANGKIYRTIHWVDKTFANRAPESLVVVIDTATDQVVERITVPCGGLDFGTITDDGKLFFSTWTGSVGSRIAIPSEPATCFAQIDPKTNTVVSTKTFAEISGGREGASLRSVGKGKLAFASFDASKVSAAGKTPQEVVGTPAFDFWLYDPATNQSSVIAGVDVNTGAIYEGKVAGAHYAMIPGDQYKSTIVYKIEDGKATKSFAMDGWVLRLFSFAD